MNLLDDFLAAEVEGIRAKGLFRTLKKMGSAQGPEIMLDGRKVLNFCSNDYLGLANDPRLIAAVIEAVQQFGTGSGAARLISGNFSFVEELEKELAHFKGGETALLFNSGYHANVGVIPALTQEGDLLLSDEWNHASLIDGCRLSKGCTVIYRHNDLNHLEELLRKGKRRGAKWMIVTEAVFSMEGDLCPLPELLELADRYGAMVYLDEAHAVGVLGENGEGLAVHPLPPHLIAMGTLGKAFGSYGAFVVGSKLLRDYLINRARSFIFTTALPPAAVGASRAALEIVRGEPERRRRLWENIHFVQGLLGKEKDHRSPIFSLLVGSAEKTMEISKDLLGQGIYIQGIRPPTVPEGTSRLRLTVTSEHKEDQLNRLIHHLDETFS